MSFFFESNDADLDVVDFGEDEGVDFGPLEESYTEFVTSVSALTEAAIVAVANIQMRGLKESTAPEALTEGVKETLLKWWNAFNAQATKAWTKIKAGFNHVLEMVKNLFMSDAKWLEANKEELAKADVGDGFVVKTYEAIAGGQALVALKKADAAAQAYIKSGEVSDGHDLGMSEAVFTQMFGKKGEFKITQGQYKAALTAAPGLINLGKNIQSMQKQISIGEAASVAQLKEGDKAVNAASPDGKEARDHAKRAQAILANTKKASAFMVKAINKSRSGVMSIVRGGLAHSKKAPAKKEGVEFGFLTAGE